MLVAITKFEMMETTADLRLDPSDQRIDESLRLQNACRLCLKEQLTESVDLFAEAAEVLQQTYSSLVQSLIHLSFIETDSLPKQICLECGQHLLHFYSFKQKCELSQCTLNALLVSQVNFDAVPVAVPKSPTGSDVLETTSCSSNHEETVSNDSVENINTFLSETVAANQCIKCGQLFTRKSSLAQHLMSHESIKPFSCSVCQARFTRKIHVKIHMRRHTNEKPYVCNQCPVAFRKSSDLGRHKKIHSNRKDYICEICGTTFKRRSDVASHMNTHTGHKPYKCQQCPQTYSAHSSMMKHCRKFGHI